MCGLKSGKYEGFARVYVLAAEIIAYTDNRIRKRELEDYLRKGTITPYVEVENIPPTTAYETEG